MAHCRGVCRVVQTLQSTSAAALRPAIFGGSSHDCFRVTARYITRSASEVSSVNPDLHSSLAAILTQRPGDVSTHSNLRPSALHKTVISSFSSTNTVEYVCPNRLLEKLSELVILDGKPGSNLAYECPVSSPVVDIVGPDTEKSEILEPGSKPVAKEAKQILRIRHKKMKKHKLKKLRKRMYFLWRKQKQTRKAKRMVIYNKELDDIRETGEGFNAEEFVRSQLSKARRGGYYINVFESKQ